MGWGARLEGGSGWGIHVNPWLIHVNVWQNPLEYCKVTSLQLIKTNGKKKKRRDPRVFKKAKGKPRVMVKENPRSELFNEPREKAVKVKSWEQKAPGGMCQEKDYRINRLLNACRSSERTFKTTRPWRYKRNLLL